eukprot:37560_1
MDSSLDIYDFSTTEYEADDDLFPIWWLTLLLLGILMVLVMLMCVFCLGSNRNASWDVLSDFNHIKSEFKSIEALKTYLSKQMTSLEMIISIVYLIVVIIINTYTNFRSFWHSHEQYVFADVDDGFLSFFTKYMSSAEIIFSFITFVMILISHLKHIHIVSVYLTISWATSISGLIYFAIANVEGVTIIKYKLFDTFNSQTSSRITKLGSMFLYFAVIIIYGFIGIGVFVIKVNQINYIYETDLRKLILSPADIIVVIGTAHQFASLYSMCESRYCWKFVFMTIHPSRRKEMTDADPDWYKPFDVDKVVCQHMIQTYGLWGYCWLCYTFNKLDNVKKMYLQHTDTHSDVQKQYFRL